MSLKEIVEPIYNQIMNQNVLAENKMIRALDETLFASNSGTNTLGAAGHIIKPKLTVDNNGDNSALDIVSTSPNDTRDTGTGARTVEVEGLFFDGSDSKRKYRKCVFKMNGTTTVNTGTGIESGTNLFCVVNSIVVKTHGTNLSNVGTITAKQTGSTLVMGVLQPTHFSSKMLSYAPPTKHTLLIKELYVSSFSQTGSSIKMFVQNLNTGSKDLIGKISLSSGVATDVNMPVNLKMPPDNVVYVEITEHSGSGSIVGNNQTTVNLLCIESK